MKRTNATSSSENPTGLSPEFTSWLEAEKSHSMQRISVVRTGLLIVLNIALIVIIRQPGWLNDVFGFIQTILFH